VSAAGFRAQESEAGALPAPRSRVWPGHAIRFVAFFLIVAAIQYASGAFLDGYSTYPDEPSHYVTSLMMRDFFAAGLPMRGGMRFAQDFYLHYPKVGLGHWPPVGYCLYGLWMLLFGPGRVSALLVEAFFTACCALLLYIVARRVGLAELIADGLAFAFVVLPIVQTHNAMVMLEVPLTLFSFAAALVLVRLLESDEWADGVLFGLLTSLAIMTKGNGWALPLMPLIAVLFTRQYRRLMSPRLWLAGAITAVMCIPFTLWSMKMVKDGWDADQASGQFTVQALPRLGSYLFTMIGPVLGVLLIVGLAVKLMPHLRRRTGMDTFWAVMSAYVLSAWLFHAIVPTSIEPRKLFTLLPALLLFAGAGIQYVLERWPSMRHGSRAAALATALCVAFVVTTVRIHREYCTAMGRVADFLLSRPELKGTAIAMASIIDGEGRLIAELAQREVWPSVYLVRASKMIADTNWQFTHYKLRYSTPEQITAALVDVPAGIVVVHSESGRPPMPHHSLVKEAMDDRAKWQKIYSIDSPCTRHWRGEQIDVYQYRLAPIRKPVHLAVDLENKINQTLKLEDVESKR
jgi:hypothetical protein